ncbi:MAG: CARDB domain-containing protein [Vicinamibacterales bacterium]
MTATPLRIPAIVVLLGVAVASGQPAIIAQADRRASARGTHAGAHAPDEVLVRFRRGASASARASAHRRHGASVSRPLHLVDNLYRVRLPHGSDPQAVSDSYRRDPDVLYAEPNWLVRSLQAPRAPDDPAFDLLWGLQNTGQTGGVPGADIDAPAAWGITTGGGDGVVAILDTGVDYNHPDLSANMFRNPGDCSANGIDDDGNGYVDDCYGIDAVNDDSDPMDDFGHGTHVAGTIGAVGNNSNGIVGVSWNTRLMACKFLDDSGSGSIADAIECMDYVLMMKSVRGVNIIATNNSWGGGEFSQGMYDAIESHRQAGILFVAAAGNFAEDTDVSPMYPAAYYLPNVISVAATNSSDEVAYFSNYGRYTAHLGAPGEDIRSTTPGNTYSTFSGTSMAAPHVTGVVALLKAEDPTRSAAAIKNLILAGAEDHAPMADTTISGKRLNAYGALTCADSVVARRLRPMAPVIVNTPGLPIDLAVLNINCAAPRGDVIVAVEETGEAVTLVDGGSGIDQGAGDGVYSGQWTSPGPGTYTLRFPNGDSIVVDDAHDDLAVTNLTDPPAMLAPGEFFSVTDTTHNRGVGSGGSSVTRFYLSTDTAWDSTDTLMDGFRMVSDLAGGTSSTGTETVSVSFAQPLGQYYLIACADDTQLLTESDETNNCAGAATPTVVSRPDLLVTTLSNPPGTSTRDASFTVTETTVNQGAAAPGFENGYYLSADQSWSATDTLLSGIRPVFALPPNASSVGLVTMSVPVATALGPYYLLACADYRSQVLESDEDNNCKSSATTILIAQPDLTVSSTSNPPAVIGPGTGFSAADTTLNIGLADAATSVTRFYLSADTAWSASDILLTGTRAVPGLAKDVSSTGSITVTVPATLVSGTFYLLACADDSKLNAEANEGNNCRASVATGQIINADLVVSALSEPPPATGLGVTFSITDTNTNQGSGGSVASVNRYYLSADTLWSSTDKLLTGTRSVPALSGGISSTGTVTVTVPTNTAIGTYYLVACADDTKLVPEGNETNNCRAAAGTVSVARPDLAVSAVANPPALIGLGGTLSASDTTLNQGVGAAQVSGTRYYLSTDTLWSTFDKLLTGGRSVPSLLPGISSAGTATVTVPTNTALGAYFLIACADDTKVVVEANETNNCQASTSVVQVIRPDLMVSAISNPPGSVLPGGRFSATDTTVNQGATAAASVTRYYLSIDAAWDAADKLLTGTRSVPSLANTASSTGTVTVTVPAATVAGNYSLLACADDTKLVAESVETNNCKASLAKVLVLSTAGPDLALTLTASANPSRFWDPLTYTLVVSNIGNVTTTAVTAQDVLSPDVALTSVTTTKGTCSGISTITCALGSLAPGASVTITVVVAPRNDGGITNTASVAAAQAESNTANNQVSLEIQITM